MISCSDSIQVQPNACHVRTKTHPPDFCPTKITTLVHGNIPPHTCFFNCSCPPELFSTSKAFFPEPNGFGSATEANLKKMKETNESCNVRTNQNLFRSFRSRKDSARAGVGTIRSGDQCCWNRKAGDAAILPPIKGTKIVAVRARPNKEGESGPATDAVWRAS